MNIPILQNLRKYIDSECQQTDDIHMIGALDAIIRAIDYTLEDESRREALDAQLEKDFYRSETP